MRLGSEKQRYDLGRTGGFRRAELHPRRRRRTGIATLALFAVQNLDCWSLDAHCILP